MVQPIHLRKNLPGLIEDAEKNLSPRLRWLLDRMWQEWKQIEIDVVAIAKKLARIAWAVLSSGQDYRHQPLPQLAAA